MWQPIESAPTDGTRILVYGSKRLLWAVAYFDKDGWYVETCSEGASIYPPRFWQPLPEPPKETSNATP